MPNEYQSSEDLQNEVKEQQEVLEQQVEERQEYAEDLLTLEGMLESAFNILDTFLFGGAIGKLMDFLKTAIGERKINVQQCNNKIDQSKTELEAKQRNLEQGIEEQENKINEMETVKGKLNFRDLDSDFDQQIEEQKADVKSANDSLNTVKKLIEAAIQVLQAGLGVVGALGQLFTAIGKLF
jgi:phage shock protein A